MPDWLSTSLAFLILMSIGKGISLLASLVFDAPPLPPMKPEPIPHRCIAEGWSDEGFQGDEEYWVPEECIEYPCLGEDGQIYREPYEKTEEDCTPRPKPGYWSDEE